MQYTAFALNCGIAYWRRIFPRVSWDGSSQEVRSLIHYVRLEMDPEGIFFNQTYFKAEAFCVIVVLKKILFLATRIFAKHSADHAVLPLTAPHRLPTSLRVKPALSKTKNKTKKTKTKKTPYHPASCFLSELPSPALFLVHLPQPHRLLSVLSPCLLASHV